MKPSLRRSLSRRSLIPLIASVLMLSLLVLQGTPAWATRITVSTSHMEVGLTFPATAHLGETFTVGAHTIARSSGRVVSFSIDILAYVNGQLVTLASQTIIADKTVQTGEDWLTSLSVTIPVGTQPGPLTGRATEVWQATQTRQSTSYLNYYPSNYGSSLYPTSYCSLYQYSGRCDTAYSNYGYPNYYSQYYTYPYSGYYNQYYTYPYYGYNNPYSGTYVYNRQPYVSYPTRNTAFWTPTDTRYVYEPAYVCQPAAYYGPNYVPNYPANYASQTSQRTFMLTSIILY